VKKREHKKGQIHKVFEDSFDAKECHSNEFIFEKLDSIHHNPVSKKWQLVTTLPIMNIPVLLFTIKE